MRRTIDIVGRAWRTVFMAASATAFAVLMSHGAAADLVGSSETRTAIAGKSDDALIEANPVLERLGRESPALLREVLERLRTPAPEPSGRRSLEQNQPRPTTKTETAVLGANPDLANLYRESPEAALDLLRLIREAAKKR